MSERRETIRARRAGLQQRAALERAELRTLTAPWVVRLRAVDRCLWWVRVVRRSPRAGLAVAAAALVLALPAPRGDHGGTVRSAARLLAGLATRSKRSGACPLPPDPRRTPRSPDWRPS